MLAPRALEQRDARATGRGARPAPGEAIARVGAILMRSTGERRVQGLRAVPRIRRFARRLRGRFPCDRCACLARAALSLSAAGRQLSRAAEGAAAIIFFICGSREKKPASPARIARPGRIRAALVGSGPALATAGTGRGQERPVSEGAPYLFRSRRGSSLALSSQRSASGSWTRRRQGPCGAGACRWRLVGAHRERGLQGAPC